MQRTWTIVAVGATVVGLGLGGAAIANADAGTSAEPVQPISVGAADPAVIPVVTVDSASSAGAAQIVDDSPESVDSPFESPIDSPESPFDSPDDDQLTPDTPDDLTPDTPDTPEDD